MTGTLSVLLRACWLLLIIRQIAISGVGFLVPCLPQDFDDPHVCAGQGDEQACLSIFLRDVGV